MPEDDLPETVYHYTDIHGLQGIYEHGKLWATNSRYLNDTSEIQLGVVTLKTRLLQGRLELMKEENDLLNARLDATEQDREIPDTTDRESEIGTRLKKLQRLLDAAERVSKNEDTYVTSLSAAPDQLSQWRGYAKDGYCIGFSTELLRKGMGTDFDMRPVAYQKGTTDDDVHAKRTHELIDQLMDDIDTDDDFSTEDADWIVSSVIRQETAFVKDRHFSEEAEIRIVPNTWRPPDLFTPNRYGMVPRILIDLPDGAITKVIVGPGAHQELRIRSLIEYFMFVKFKKDDNSSSKPKIERSIIPYRDW
ncbi:MULTISPECIES: DUF2971 domain-containing protein [unclassified Rhodococcus (in: high G+C Gram-positive bacteria)]|jgi:hypothetical protein|uniref:DUF2971 domain-containing protein n=1 Tax=unclassified Rhodococcus (in: high G+C Gram-positive bacteria) TaxID=192944 RepID=UPI0031402D06